MHARFYSAFVILMAVGLALWIAQIEIDKSKLHRQIASLSQSEASLARLHTESSRNRALLAQFKTSSDAGAKAIQADLVTAQAELAALETKAAGSRADARATPSIDANRDPTKAMTRPEFLSNVGRATPEAAFQTLIWAAMKGREPEMAACLSLDNAARAKAESLLAGLSPEARVKYGSPEQLFGLAFSHSVLESTAVQFATSSIDGGDQVTLTVRVRANSRENNMNIPMFHSADGWAMAVGERQIDVIRHGLTAEPPAR